MPTVEFGVQRAGLGATLAYELFREPEVTVPPALYTFGCMLTGTVLARWWAGKNHIELGFTTFCDSLM